MLIRWFNEDGLLLDTFDTKAAAGYIVNIIIVSWLTG